MTYWVLRVVRKIAQLLPLRVCYAAAVLLSDIAWALLSEQRENAIDNMARVLGLNRDDREVRRKAKGAFRNYALYMADFLRLPKLGVEELEARFQFNGWEHLDQALAAGKGVIFISAHVGNWDLGAALFARRGYPVSVVAESFHPKKLNDLVQGTRSQHGMKVIPLEASARRVLGALRKNEILGLLIDRPSPESGVLVRFFGGVTQVPAGAALLALKTGAKVISGVIVRNPDHTYSGFVTSHFDVDLTGDLSVDVRLLTQRIMDTMEGFIRQYPEQWFIFRPMWPKDVTLEA
ncbi:MAG: lysophospholipid acyltransferase family protein [Chloroflexota bacterium]